MTKGKNINSVKRVLSVLQLTMLVASVLLPENMCSWKAALALCALINIQTAKTVSIFQRLPRTNQLGNSGLLDSVLNNGRPAGSSLIQTFFGLNHQRGASYVVPPCEKTPRRQALGVPYSAKPDDVGRLVNDLLLPTYQAPDLSSRPSFPYPPAITTPKVLPAVPLNRNRLPAIAKVTTFSASRTHSPGNSLNLPTVAKPRRFSLNRLVSSTARPTFSTTVAKGLVLTLPKPLSLRTLPLFADLPRVSPNTHKPSTYSYGFNVPKRAEFPINRTSVANSASIPLHLERPTNFPKAPGGNSWQRDRAAALKLPLTASAPTFAPNRSASLSNIQPSSTHTKLPESQSRPVLATQPSRNLASLQARRNNIVVSTLKQRSDATATASVGRFQRPVDSHGDLVANGSEHLDEYAYSGAGRSDIPIESEPVGVPAQKQENSIGRADLERQPGNELKTPTSQGLEKSRRLVRVFKRPVATPPSRDVILISATNELPSPSVQ